MMKENGASARRQERLDRRMDWFQRRVEGTSTEPYVPPPIVQEADYDDFDEEESDPKDE